MTAKIIPFPERPDPAFVSVTMPGANIFELNDCTGVVHFFEDTTGPCKCGKETWPPKEDK